MYDADYYQIEMLQRYLAQNGITKEELDLDNYVGLTYSELKSIADNAIRSKEAKRNDS